MKKIGRDDLLKELSEIQKKAEAFFKKVLEVIGDEPERSFYGKRYERDLFWNKIPDDLQKLAKSLITRIVENTPLIAESARMTPFLTVVDQHDLGHAIKGMRAALNLCYYRYWDTEVLHDEGTVLGVRAAGQSDDVGLHPAEAAKIFEDCFRRVFGTVELVSPSSLEFAESQIAQKGKLVSGYKPDTAFIMMWMDPSRSELDDVCDTVKRCFKKFNIEAMRSDDIQHDDLITKRIIEEIQSSEFLFADLTGERPSVYYEVGYAHAIGRRVILFRKKDEKIHFDLAGYNCPEYTNLRDLEQSLMKRLSYVTGREPK